MLLCPFYDGHVLDKQLSLIFSQIYMALINLAM